MSAHTTSPASPSNVTYPMHLEKGTLNGQPITGGWMAEVALSKELAEADSHLDAHAWDTVISALRSNLPIVVTVRDRVGSERTRTFVAMIDYAIVENDGRANRLRLRSWGGFSSDYYSSEIQAVGTPDVTWA